MGCVECCEKIPKGIPMDPLTMEGDIIKNIAINLHIEFSKEKIKQFLNKKKKNPNLNPENFVTTSEVEHQKYVRSINDSLKDNP